MKLLVTESEDYSVEALKNLSSKFSVTCGVEDKRDLLSKVKDVDILLVRLGYWIDREVISNAKRLKIIATPTTGLNHIDIEYASERGIKIISLKGEVEFLSEITPTAELSFGLILSLYRHIPSAITHVKKNGWDRNLFVGKELKGKTIGIIGLGRLGKMLSRYCMAFGMEVIYYDTELKDGIDGVRFVELDELLALSDIISVHIPYNKATHRFIDRNRIEKMKKGVCLVNTSRGEVLDEDALLDGVKSGKITGVGLDVVCNEPDDGGEIRSSLVEYAKTSDRILITPHIGGACFDSMRQTEEFVANKILHEKI